MPKFTRSILFLPALLALGILFQPCSAHASGTAIGWGIVLGAIALTFFVPLVLGAVVKYRIAKSWVPSQISAFKWGILAIAVLEAIILWASLSTGIWLVRDEIVLKSFSHVSDTLAIWYFEYTPAFWVGAAVTMIFCFIGTLVPHAALLRVASKGHDLVGRKLLIRSAVLSVVTPLACAVIAVPFLGSRGYAPLRYSSEDSVKGEETTGFDALLRRAVLEGRADIVAILLRKGANPNSKTQKYGETPLTQAASKGNSEIVRILLDNGADVNARTTIGTALNDVVRREGKYVSVAEMLIKHGADVNSRTQLGDTPLIQVSSVGRNTAMARFLIQHGANIDARNSNGNDALCKACTADMIGVLIENGADINREIERGKNLLTMAADRGCPSAVEFYLQNGFDVNATNNNGYSALHFARSVKVAKPLLDHGADVNLCAINGFTPLMKAVSYLNVEPGLATLYLERGADVNARNILGMTALTYAKARHDKRVIKILEQYGAQE